MKLQIPFTYSCKQIFSAHTVIKIKNESQPGWDRISTIWYAVSLFDWFWKLTVEIDCWFDICSDLHW